MCGAGRRNERIRVHGFPMAHLRANLEQRSAKRGTAFGSAGMCAEDSAAKRRSQQRRPLLILRRDSLSRFPRNSADRFPSRLRSGAAPAPEGRRLQARPQWRRAHRERGRGCGGRAHPRRCAPFHKRAAQTTSRSRKGRRGCSKASRPGSERREREARQVGAVDALPRGVRSGRFAGSSREASTRECGEGRLGSAATCAARSMVSWPMRR